MSGAASADAASDTPSRRPPTPAKDLEYGYGQQTSQVKRAQTPSVASSKRSSVPADSNDTSTLPWNASHPCYPHANPHVPLASPLQTSTRIIRIPRDWMIAGDLAPTYSNTYPEILEPWVSEQSFRTLIQGINTRLIRTFNPYGWRAWMDLVLGLLTGWIWDDLGCTGAKLGCKEVEEYIEQWNRERSSIDGIGEKDEDADLVKAMPLHRTGYLSVDIQIPDPHVGLVEEDDALEENNNDNIRNGTI